jgi:hypothetical protein
MGGQMGKGMKQVQKGAPAAKPAPVPPPVAKGPSPVPRPAPAAPDAPKPMTPQEIADFEKKMAEAKREPEKVAAAQPPAPAAAPEQKPAAPAPAATAKPEVKPEATAKPKPEVKPAVVAAAEPKPKPKPKPKPEPKPAAEVPTPLVTEPPAPAPARPAESPAPAAPAAPATEPPAPERPATPRAPAVPAVTAIAPLTGVVRTPKFNDVMTAVMYRDVAAAAELLELGWWVDRRDSNRVTPLMAAAWLGDLAMTQLLLKGGADPTLRSPAGSVLDYADRGGDPQIIELLKRSGAR